MVHSGYEASAVHDNFNTLRGFFDTVKATFFHRYADAEALRMLDEPVKPVHERAGLVQLTVHQEANQEAGEEVEV
jgi:hypothetical protein